MGAILVQFDPMYILCDYDWPRIKVDRLSRCCGVQQQISQTRMWDEKLRSFKAFLNRQRLGRDGGVGGRGGPRGGGVAVPRAGGGEVFVGNGRFAPHPRNEYERHKPEEDRRCHIMTIHVCLPEL